MTKYYKRSTFSISNILSTISIILITKTWQQLLIRKHERKTLLIAIQLEYN